jgi:flagellar hook-associated protein 3 FlgL
VGFNQTIRVNSTADECFKHGIGRAVDDLVQAMQEVVDMQKIKDDLESLKENATGDTLAEIESKLLVVNKAYDLMKDKAQRMFESGITTMQGYLDEANLSITNCGTRSSKLELIKNRMQTQKTTFETLKSENEDVDITDIAIKLSSAQLTYEAALMATGKVTQTSLLNYI